MLKIRSRVINFRVTEDEFSRLRNASVQEGARCLSEYARETLLATLELRSDPKSEFLNGNEKLSALELRVSLAELSLARLEGKISAMRSEQNEHAPVTARM